MSLSEKLLKKENFKYKLIYIECISMSTSFKTMFICSTQPVRSGSKETHKKPQNQFYSLQHMKLK